jgi:hypothetical protein
MVSCNIGASEVQTDDSLSCKPEPSANASSVGWPLAGSCVSTFSDGWDLGSLGMYHWGVHAPATLPPPIAVIVRGQPLGKIPIPILCRYYILLHIHGLTLTFLIITLL